MMQLTQQGIPRETGHGKDVGNVVHHNIHPRQLTPNLREQSNMRPINIFGREEIDITHLGTGAFNIDPLSNLLKLASHPRTVRITFPVRENKDLLTFLPTILGGEPARRLGEDNHAEEENDGGDHLECPGNSESGVTVDEGTSVGNVEHDHDAPGDGPLLRAD